MIRINLSILMAIVLFSCGKKDSIEPIPKPVTVFYRLAMKDVDSNYTYSVVESISVVEYISESSPCDCKKHPEDKRCKTLPISIEYFTATVNNHNTFIEWKTTYEEGIEAFVVEKSLDGLKYTPVTKEIKPKGASVYRVLFIN